MPERQTKMKEGTERQFHLRALSPLDGRYHAQVSPLSAYFSEYALTKKRVQVEIAYFTRLCQSKIEALRSVKPEWLHALKEAGEAFSLADAMRVKDIEAELRHDVKAVEYFLREKLRALVGKVTPYEGFIHFGLSSQDINNTATPCLLKEAQHKVMLVAIQSLVERFAERAQAWRHTAMLARTHGQPALPHAPGKGDRRVPKKVNRANQAYGGHPLCGQVWGGYG